jgi:hypothetical protein
VSSKNKDGFKNLKLGVKMNIKHDTPDEPDKCKRVFVTQIPHRTDDKCKRVFVTQIPHRTDDKTGAFVPSLNINPASEFGEIKILMPPRCAIFDTVELSKQLAEAFKDFNNDLDCLLPLGDPIISAVACSLLGRRFDYYDVLRWDKSLGRYTKSRVVI